MNVFFDPVLAYEWISGSIMSLKISNYVFTVNEAVWVVLQIPTNFLAID